MNRIYSLVWNRNRNQLQVASELARAHGGSSAAGSARRGNRTRTALTLAVLAALGLVAAPPGWTAECDVTLDSNQSGADGTPGVAGDTAYAAPFGDTVCVDAGVDATGGAGGEGSSDHGGYGGFGIYGDGATIINNGHIVGGEGGTATAAPYQGGDGAAGLIGFEATAVVEAGQIKGGAGGDAADYSLAGYGGQGILSAYGDISVATGGKVTGGAGGSAGDYGYGGDGGAGIQVDYAGQIEVNGTTQGGDGGSAGDLGDGGSGGLGIDLGLFGNYGGYGDGTIEVGSSGEVIGGAGGNAGANGRGGVGGFGIAAYSGQFIIDGLVVGGTGGSADSGTDSLGGMGGFGIYADSADIEADSSARIQGGAGGNAAEGYAGSGGWGIVADTLELQLAEGGEIIGGAGGDGASDGYGGVGGHGIFADEGNIHVDGRVSGGAGGQGYLNGYGYFYGPAHDSGGAGGAGIVTEQADIKVGSTGEITGGAGGESYYAYYAGSAGGHGIQAYAADNIHIDGVVRGGDGGDLAVTPLNHGPAGYGGHGVMAGDLYNLDGGGSSIHVGSDALITGGAGGDLGDGGYSGGRGGVGLAAIKADVHVDGEIRGGAGGNGMSGDYAGFGGPGLAGYESEIVIGPQGRIIGGDEGAGNLHPNPNGGAGLGGEDLDVTTAGEISGGQRANGETAPAIVFTAGENRLELQQGYTLNGAVIAAGSDDTLALGGDGDVDFDLDAIGDDSSDRQFRGFDAFEKTGTSTWTLAGDSSETGSWTIKDGGLIVGGDASNADTRIAGDVEVEAGALLGGHGTVGNLVNFGTVAPGNSVGTLTVAGDYTAEAGSVHEVEINAAGNADLLKVEGKATLESGSSVNVLTEPGFYEEGKEYIILTAEDGVSDEYDELTASQLVFLDPSLAYNPDNVVLSFERNDVAFEDFADTRNQRAAATGAESAAGTALAGAMTSLDKRSAGDAFDAISGEFHASRQSALFEDSRYLRQAVSNRLDRGCAPAQPTGAEDDNAVRREQCANSLWLQPYGDWGRISSNSYAAKLKHNVAGFFLGGDKQITPEWRVGLVAGYRHTSDKVRERDSRGKNDSYQLGVYTGWTQGPLNLKAGLAHEWHDLDSKRNVNVAGLNEQLKADYRAHTTQLFAEGGYAFDFDQTRVEPFLRAGYMHFKIRGFDEKGGAAALSARSESKNLATTLAGVRVDHAVHATDTATVNLHGMIGWRHTFGSTTPRSRFSFEGGDEFTIKGVSMARDAATVAAGVHASVGQDLTVGASYVGQFGDGVNFNGIQANLAWHF